MKMFNEEDFIKDYVEAIKNPDSSEEDLTKLTMSLPRDNSSEFYTNIIENLIKNLKAEDGGDYSKEIKRLENTASLMSFMSELADQDSNTEEAKDSEPVEVEEVAEDATADSVSEAEAVEGSPAEDGNAPAEEEQEEKTDTDK